MKIDTLESTLIGLIETGKIGDENNKLPSEPQLMAQFGVTRYTLREALKRLRAQGYIFQSQGRGVFVRRGNLSNYLSIQETAGLSDDLGRRGHSLETKSVEIRHTTATNALFQPESITLDPEERLIEVNRLRYVDGAPYSKELAYYIEKIVPEIPKSAAQDSIFKFLRTQYHLNTGFADKIISSDHLPDQFAKELELPEGSPALIVHDEAYLTSGKLFNYSCVYYKFDRVKLFTYAKMR